MTNKTIYELDSRAAVLTDELEIQAGANGLSAKTTVQSVLDLIGNGKSGYSGVAGTSGYSGIAGTSGFSGFSGAAGSGGAQTVQYLTLNTTIDGYFDSNVNNVWMVSPIPYYDMPWYVITQTGMYGDTIFEFQTPGMYRLMLSCKATATSGMPVGGVDEFLFRTQIDSSGGTTRRTVAPSHRRTVAPSHRRTVAPSQINK